MTKLTTEELKDLLSKVTPGEWTGHNMVHSETGKQMTPEEMGEYVCESVKMGDPSRFLFVSGKHDDGDDCDICLTGNGPRGPFNTALIALAPTLAAEVVRLREAMARRAVKDIQRLVDWLNEDEYHAELLLAHLTNEEIESARQALSQK